LISDPGQRQNDIDFIWRRVADTLYAYPSHIPGNSIDPEGLVNIGLAPVGLAIAVALWTICNHLYGILFKNSIRK
jgi:hypothetical protein